jgi:ATP-binding cassette subfamily C protein CydC
MRDLLRIMGVWRGQRGVLAAGLAVSLLSVAAGLALAVSAGALAFAPGQPGGRRAAGIVAVLLLPVVLRGLGVSRVALRYLERLATHAATFRALAALRVWLFRGLAVRSAGGLGLLRSGDVLARLVGDVESLDGLYLRILVPGAAALLILPVLGWVLGGYDPGVAVAVCGLFVLAAFLLPWAAATASVNAGAQLAAASGGLRTAALDVFDGLREVRAYGAEGRMLALVQSREAALLQAQRGVARSAALAQAGALACGQLALLAVLLLPPAQAVSLVTAVFLTLAAFEVVSGMPRAGVLAGSAAGAAARLLAIMDAPAPAPDPDVPVALPAGTAIRFEGVGFRWQADRPAVLDGLTLDIPAGSRVAVLGPSGSGKSTLASLLLRVVAPDTGRILLGGVDLARLSAAEVRSRMAWLSQGTHLFSDTIRDNLRLALPEAADAEMWQALEQAQIAELVRALPGGLDAWVGQGGAGVSGGQARRLELARALLSRAPILILDEPATGLDADTERAFLATLNDVAPGRTVVLIVHRLIGIERLDRVYRISAGRAVAAAA